MSDHVNLLKLCVGAERVEDLEVWQARRAASTADGLPCHVTRMWPRRADEVLRGGSLYWVFKGVILARQRILRLDPQTGDDGVTRCAIVMEAQITRTEAAPRRPFQGWRYLDPADAPRDLEAARGGDDDLPAPLRAALAEIGVR